MRGKNPEKFGIFTPILIREYYIREYYIREKFVAPIMALSIVAFSIITRFDFVIQCNAMPSVVRGVSFFVLLSALMPSDILPSVVRLNVVVPDCQYKSGVKFT